MDASVVWRFRGRQDAQDWLWAWLELRGLTGCEHLVVCVDWRERVYVGLSFSALYYRGEELPISPPRPWYHRAELAFGELLEDPYRWGEIYLDQGVTAFRHWQGRAGWCYRQSKGGTRCW